VTLHIVGPRIQLDGYQLLARVKAPTLKMGTANVNRNAVKQPPGTWWHITVNHSSVDDNRLTEAPLFQYCHRGVTEIASLSPRIRDQGVGTCA